MNAAPLILSSIDEYLGPAETRWKLPASYDPLKTTKSSDVGRSLSG